MDVFEALQELKKESAVDTARKPLAPAEGNNGITTCKPRTREVSSRYKSPTRSTTSNSNSRRYPSPTLTRTVNPSSQLASKRAVSAERKRPSTPTYTSRSSTPVSDTAERKRPSTPTSTSRPSTPVSDTSAEQQLSSKKIGSRLPEVLWPSTMRSLSVSFQSDSISIPVSKKEKPVTHALSDRTLKPSSNVAHKQAETTAAPRKSTPERKRSPVKVRNSTHQSENSRPVDGVKVRLIDQHRWPSRAGGGKLPSNILTKSVDLLDNVGKIQSSSLSGTGMSLRRLSAEGAPDIAGRIPSSSLSGAGVSSRRLSAEGFPDNVGKNPSSLLSGTGISVRRLSAEGVPDSARKIPSSPLMSAGIPSRRLSAEGIPRNSPKNSVDPAGQSVFDDHTRAVGLRLKSVDDIFLRESALQKEEALSSSRRASIGALPVRSKLSPGQRLPSPSRIPIIKFTPGPAITRLSTPTQSRGASPSRITPSSPTKQSSSTASVLSFVADVKGKKIYQLEDAHLLRLLHNRYLQWRFANAQADATMYIQKITAEESLYNVWQANLELWDSVITKRIDVQRLKLELKLKLVLKEQLAYLEDWALLERDHSTSLDGAIKDLEASTLRLPLTGGAKAEIDSLKAAISSAVDVVQAMGYSISSILSKVEDANRLVSELAALAGQERAMVNECDALLASTAAMQVKEYSLRTQLIQWLKDSRKTRAPLLWAT